MAILDSPPAAVLLLAALLLTVWGAGVKGAGPLSPISFLGGLCWTAGTLWALMEGAGLDEVLVTLLVLMLASTGFWRRVER